MEKYIQIKEFKNYEVSNLGNVRNIKTGLIRKQQLDSRGHYYQLNLSKDGKKYKLLTHRLVATTHIENPNNLPEVDHKDRNKLNNVSTNLVWTTKKLNLENSILGKNPFITFNSTINIYLVYNPLIHQYIECISINDAVYNFQLLIPH